jgi:LysR family transcriptional regulator, transcription activator of glutamate synthase operon
MDLTQLVYFRAAATHEHFTRAAEAAHVAQPALSRQIKALETELGLPLFDRIGRGVRLTAAGRAIFPRVERMLAEVEAIRRDVRSLSNLEGGTVALGFLHSIGAHLLPSVLAAFRGRHPGVGFTLHEAAWLELEERVAHGDLDLAITSPVPAQRSDLSGHPLLRDDLVAALPPRHPLAAADEVQLGDLAHEPFIFLGASFGELRTITRDACARAGFAPRVAFEAEGLATMRGLVGAGLGVALLPALASRVRDEGAPAPICRPLAGRPAHRVIGLVRHAERSLSPAASAFAEVLIARYRQQQAGIASSRSVT